MMTSHRSYKLGRIVGTKRILGITDKHRSTHMHVIGASGTGKSKLLEYLIRQDILASRGLCLIDPHGELADNILAWASRLPMPPRHLHYIAPHKDDWTICYNPLYKRDGQDTDDWFLINAMKIAVVKCWGGDDTQETPRLDEWLKNAFFTAVTLGMTLPEVGMLLEPIVERNVQRMAVVQALPDSATRIKSSWVELCQLAEKKRPVDFEARVGSTVRRLAAFLDNPRLSRIFGVPDVSIDLASIMDSGGVIIVDLSIQGRFHPQDSQLFGTLLLTDFYIQMFNRKNRQRPFSLIIDEFQNYATKDLARMLDEARKFGLQLVLAHQRPGQLQNSDSAEERDLYSAVMTNARTKVVFGGIFPDELEPIAKMLSMGVLDPYKIKNEIRTRSVVDYVKEYWTAHGHSTSRSQTSASGGSSGTGHSNAFGNSQASATSYNADTGSVFGPPSLCTSESQGWQSNFGSSDFSGESWSEASSEGESESTTVFPVLVPQMGEQLSSVYYETLEDQLHQFAAVIHDL
ncbi:type IV secretory system conjugative DNA transfer family protein, partial [Candidatus Sumerlaeota bacterium]